MIKRTRQLTAIALVIMLMVGISSCQPASQLGTQASNDQSGTIPPGHRVKVRPALNYADDSVLVEIINIGLEKLGYETTAPKLLDTAIGVTAVSARDIDFLFGFFDPEDNETLKNLRNSSNIVKVGVQIPNFLTGYQVDKRTADRYKIADIKQLKDPTIAKLFDTNGDGKANLLGCDQSWPCYKIVEHHLDAYGLRNTVKQDTGEYSALLPNIAARYKRGEPILLVGFFPNNPSRGQFLRLNQNVVWLTVPFTTFPPELKQYTQKDTSASGKNLGFFVNQLRIVANKQFLEANPVVRLFLEQIQFSHEEYLALSQQISKSKSISIKNHQLAEEWVNNHQQQFDLWIEVARKKRQSS